VITQRVWCNLNTVKQTSTKLMVINIHKLRRIKCKLLDIQDLTPNE